MNMYLVVIIIIIIVITVASGNEPVGGAVERSQRATGTQTSSAEQQTLPAKGTYYSPVGLMLII